MNLMLSSEGGSDETQDRLFSQMEAWTIVFWSGEPLVSLSAIGD